MRNYFKLRALKWHLHATDGVGNINTELYVFARDDSDLLARVAEIEAQNRAALPAWTFDFTYPNPPLDYYWMLDKSNFINLLNLDALDFYEQGAAGP